jgi:hypothetical protein
MLGTVVPSASRVNGVISMVKFTPDKGVWPFTGIHLYGFNTPSRDDGVNQDHIEGFS